MVVTLARPLEIRMSLAHVVHPLVACRGMINKILKNETKKELVAWRLKQLVHLLQQCVSLQSWDQATHLDLQAKIC